MLQHMNHEKSSPARSAAACRFGLHSALNHHLHALLLAVEILVLLDCRSGFARVGKCGKRAINSFDHPKILQLRASSLNFPCPRPTQHHSLNAETLQIPSFLLTLRSGEPPRSGGERGVEAHLPKMLRVVPQTNFENVSAQDTADACVPDHSG